MGDKLIPRRPGETTRQYIKCLNRMIERLEKLTSILNQDLHNVQQIAWRALKRTPDQPQP
jgi:hypothetical protein